MLSGPIVILNGLLLEVRLYSAIVPVIQISPPDEELEEELLEEEDELPEDELEEPEEPEDELEELDEDDELDEPDELLLEDDDEPDEVCDGGVNLSVPELVVCL